MDDGSVAALAVFGIFVMPVLGWIVVRYLAHRERLEMIRHGIVPPIGKMNTRAWREAARSVPPDGMPYAAPPQRQPSSCEPDFSVEGERIALRKGIRLTFIGVALTVGLSFIGYSETSTGWSLHPGPWLLGGLIPLFIGLAQVTSAMLGGATFGSTRFGSGSMPPPSAPPPFGEPFTAPGGAPSSYDTSYTYRPDGTAELRPPSYPPERR